jgi:arylsulfatase A-like enzyme
VESEFKAAGPPSRSIAAVALVVAALGCVPDPPETAEQRSTWPRPRNVIFIVIDALRADHLGAFGYERDTTPHLDRLAEEGFVFSRAYSASSWTLPAVASYMTSVYPTVHGLTRAPTDDVFLALPDGFTTLAESLRAHGLRTAAITSQPWISDRTGLTQGFDESRWVAHASLPDESRILADELIEWVDLHQDEPFFLYAHFMGPHSPYDVPSEHTGRFTAGLEVPASVAEFHRLYEFESESDAYRTIVEQARRDGLTRDDVEYLRAEYDEKLAFTDASIGHLLGHMRDRGVLDESLVIVTADHGEAFYEHGTIFHGQHLYEEIVRVPLILRLPGGLEESRRIDEIAELIDLYPTIHELLGLPIPDGILGESLVPVLHGEPSDGVAFAEGFGFKVVTPGWSSFYDYADSLHVPGSAVVREMYELSVDPFEQENRAHSAGGAPTAAHLDLVARLWGEIGGIAKRYPDGHDTVELDTEAIEKLKSLGYLGGTRD